jgi:hypothetical protein
MPEKIAAICIALVLFGTIYSSFGLQWSKSVKRAYWILSSVTSYQLNDGRYVDIAYLLSVILDN